MLRLECKHYIVTPEKKPLFTSHNSNQLTVRLGWLV